MNNLEKKFYKLAGSIDLISKIPMNIDFKGFLKQLAEIADTYWFGKLKRMKKQLLPQKIREAYPEKLYVSLIKENSTLKKQLEITRERIIEVLEKYNCRNKFVKNQIASEILGEEREDE